jgi:hypothetical protein
MKLVARLFAKLALIPLLAVCTTQRVSSAPAAAAPSVRAPASSTTDNAFINALRIAHSYRVNAIASRRFTHAELWRAIAPSLSSRSLRTDTIARSVLGAHIRSVTFGTGPVRVLLWSQMHGDESTATMALADILRFLADSTPDPLRSRLGERLTITFIPMLNPDGAELFQRENAEGIDINRDARQLATPEGRALHDVRERLRPDFGFNLHDQGARTRAGPRGLQAGIALLAPPYDAEGGYNGVRTRARLVAALIAHELSRDIPGRIARYDDSFNPRAFGDAMQRAGTSTVLIESGALPDDPQKQRLRRLNVVAILVALDGIATGSYLKADPAAYEDLPVNTSGAIDLLVLGGQIVLQDRAPRRADLAINFDDPVARTGGRVRDVGDLRESVAIDTIDARGLYIHPVGAAAGPRMRAGTPAELEIRRGASANSELVRRLGAVAPSP